LYGIPCDESYALFLCPPDTDGTRLGDLSKAAIKLGMKTNVTKLTWKQLLNMQEFSILHVNDNHYVLANPNEQHNGMIRIYDPDLGARWYDQISLESIWRGTSLILTKDSDFRSSSFISTPVFWIDRGDLTTENEALYHFSIQNKNAKVKRNESRP
jgi:ABC-type bacteriocin/lantibiotic exporter with double-glycine peptidase domain